MKFPKTIKVSTLIFILIVILTGILAYLANTPNANAQVISTFCDAIKVFAGALGGAIAGEKLK